jgi:SEC-C motif
VNEIVVGLFSGHRDEDPVVRRYRAVARALRRAAGTWGDAALYSFMESEAREQLELVLATLQRVRAACGSGRKFKRCCGRSASPSDSHRPVSADYPLGTVARYGPDDRTATKLVAAAAAGG